LKTPRSSRKSAARSPKPEGKAPTARLRAAPSRELTKLRAQLADAEETLRAIRNGEVDSVAGPGKQVFTLAGAEHAYRLLIESMNEGALTLTADKMILYANQCFANMVKCPLEQVTGGSFRRFLSVADQAILRSLMKRAAATGSKIQVLLHARDGSLVPALLSIRELANEGSKDVIIGMVVTNMTEARRNEELLRALTHRVVQVQEAERGSVALELHDHITQLLCAVLVRSQTLADKLSPRDGNSKKEAVKLRELLGQTAEEVERISRNLRPSVLDELGLVAVLRDTSTEFAARTGVALKLACVELTARLPAATELALYRILQEALKNVEQHARARHVTVNLIKQGDLVQLTIKDDGIGFIQARHPAGRKVTGDLGLLGMRERATYVGGDIKVKSVRRHGLRRAGTTGRRSGAGLGPALAGTEIQVRIPLPPSTPTTKGTDL
jgi:PAS domain S-box-containing protein